MRATLFAILCVACVSENRRAGVGQDVPDTALPDLVEDSGAGDATAPDSADAGQLPGGSACEQSAECASGHCLLTRDGRACAFGCTLGVCEGERECRLVAGAPICVDRLAALCLPCDGHDDCNLGALAGLDGDRDVNRCLAVGDASAGRFCGVACGAPFGACPDGAECVEGQCRPSAGECRCSALAVVLGAETSCSAGAAGPDGEDMDALCSGSRRCVEADALASACDAAAPEAETCNGRDDDCDGDSDERPLACAGFVCRGAEGCGQACQDSAGCEPGLGCDVADRDGDSRRDECIPTGEDSTLCSLDDECDSGYCRNGHCCTPGEAADALCCAEDRDCAALDGDALCTDNGVAGCFGVKTVGRCQDAICVGVSVPSPEGCIGLECRGAQCLQGGVLDGAQLCDQSGACLESADALCDDGDPCTLDACNAAEGCLTTPTSGTSAVACYTFDPDTRGVGACTDGTVLCQNGAASGCSDEIGPRDEVCNGADDDCDGVSDEDTERACFPFLCDGASGCLSACQGDDDCAAGNFCADTLCIGTGEDGAACADDGECQSGHCGGGVCCEAGLCCSSNLDCASLDEMVCQVAEAGGCAGTSVVGVCGAGARCVTEEQADPNACDGEVCSGSRCEGATLMPAGRCDGALCQQAAPELCTPYACQDGACLGECEGDQQCSGGASCDGKACGALPLGAACGDASQCLSGHCDNGFCCGAGRCCGGDDAACPGDDSATVCTDAGACQGLRTVGRCGEDFQCTTAQVAAADACLGQRCGASECVNLAAALGQEGIRERACDASGTCVAAVRDCRNSGNAECTGGSGLFLTCGNCAPNRTTCVVYASPCYCE